MAGYNDWDQSDIYKGTVFQIVLATVSVAVRLVARQKSPAKLWWDDFTVVVALVSWRRNNPLFQLTSNVPDLRLGTKCLLLVADPLLRSRPPYQHC